MIWSAYFFIFFITPYDIKFVKEMRGRKDDRRMTRATKMILYRNNGQEGKLQVKGVTHKKHTQTSVVKGKGRK